MRALIVGGAGYIGSTCARMLSLRGNEVVTFDNLSTGYAWAVRGPLLVGDVLDRRALTEAFRSGPFDVVMHFAAQSVVERAERDPLAALDLNVAGTLALLSVMQEHGCGSLVFSSTCAVYGTPDVVPVDESAPFRPTSIYGESKVLVERILDAVRSEGLRIASLRYFNAAGAWPEEGLGESHDPESHLVPRAIAAARGDAPPLTVLGTDWPTPDGTCIRDFIHVRDLAAAHVAAADRLAGGHPGGAWNLGTGTGSSVRDVLREVGRACGREVPVVLGTRRPGDPSALRASPARARRDLGWAPQFGLQRSVQDAVDWYDRGGKRGT